MSYNDVKDSEDMKGLVGREIVSVVDNPNADEGYVITLNDGTVIDFGWSSCEGGIKITKRRVT